MKVEDMLAFAVVLPVLLLIVLGIAFVARKAKTAQGNMVKHNISLINNVVGSNNVYVDKGKLPFHIVGEDPSLHVKYANSCQCLHMLKGNYKGLDYVVTNMETMHSKGYGELSHAIFKGFYILINNRQSIIKPLYACDNDFWKEFNVKQGERLSFKVGKRVLYEGEPTAFHESFKLLLTNEDWRRSSVQAALRTAMQNLFANNSHRISLYVYSDGKLGVAIQDYKLFNFYNGKLPELRDNASESKYVRDIVDKDARVIKYYLDNIQQMIKQLP